MINHQDLVLRGRTPLSPDPAATWECVSLPGLESVAWTDRVAPLVATHPAWRDAGLVLVLADDVEITPTAVTELFRLMRLHGLSLAQPSLAWRSHFVEPVTLHNPSFAWRHASRVDPAALAFAPAALATFCELASHAASTAELSARAAAWGPDPTATAAIVDAVQCVRTAEPAADEWPSPDHPAAEPALTWGGLGLRGRRVSLFDDTREECLGLLGAGVACAVQEPHAIGDAMLQHFLRSLDPPPAAAHEAAPVAPFSPIAWKRVRRAPIVP